MMSEGYRPGKCPGDCVYSFRESGAVYCQYILITGTRRPCPPGRGCAAYKVGVGREPLPFTMQESRREWKPARAELAAQSRTIRELRMRAGLTMKSVALKLGVPTSTYCHWEMGSRPVEMERLKKAFPDVMELYAIERGR